MATMPIIFEAPPNSGPHAGGNGLLFFAYGIGIDGSNFQDGVAHPLGEQIQGDTFVERMDGIAVAQALGDTVGACGDVRLLHDGHHTPPSGGARPRPQRQLEFAPPPASLDFCEAVHQVECIQQGGRHWYGAVHAFAAFFEAFHDDHLVGKIHASGCDVEGFGNTTPGVIQEAAKGAHGPVVPQGGAEERVALPRREVEAPAKGIVERGCCMHTATEYKGSVAIARPGARRWLGTSSKRRDPEHGRDVFLHPSGGECCSLGFSTSLHRLGAWGHTYGTCRFGQWSSDAVFLGSCERRGKGNNAGVPRTACHMLVVILGIQSQPRGHSRLALNYRVDGTVLP